MELSTIEIAIAGAGMGGLAVGAMLARKGARVTLYDQMTVPQPVGSGFVLQPTGLAVIQAMGLSAPVMARGARIDRMHGKLAGSGRTVLEISYGARYFGVAIQRAALFDLLHAEALDAGVIFEPSSRIAGIQAGTRPRLLLEGGGQSAAADLVIDAMGAGSPLRQRPGTELGYGALWATVPWLADGPFHPAELEQRYRKASCMAGVLPVGSARPGAPDMATFFWSLRNGDAEAWHRAGREAWVDEVRAIWPEAAQYAEIAEPVHARYRHHTQAPIAAPGVIRIGDAWHATSPQLGQGANMALLDAASLALALERETSVADALGLHVWQRRAHVHLYQALSRILTPFYQSDSHLLPALRDMAIGPVTRLPYLSRLISLLVTGTMLDPAGRIGLDPFDTADIRTSRRQQAMPGRS